jgi:hypothetical protein
MTSINETGLETLLDLNGLTYRLENGYWVKFEAYLVTSHSAMGKMLSSIDIGNKVKMLRRHAGLTQEKLAELVGVSFQQTYLKNKVWHL